MSVDELADIEAIKQLKARYFRLMDTKQWDAWGELFTPDCRLYSEPGGGRPGIEWVGRDEIVERNRAALEGSRSVHHGHMPEIEITGPTTARGVWAMYDFLTWNGAGCRAYEGYGHYQETYEKQDGAWRIKSLRLTRLRAEFRGDW
jgi:uncharacterized protein (TIGR02246 family)